MNETRPTFDWCGKPVRAGGLLLYTWINNTRRFLLRKRNGRWEDLGGKSAPGDDAVLTMVTREVCEETNGRLFDARDDSATCNGKLARLLERELDIFYSPRAKYMLVRVEVPRELYERSLERFGSAENGVPHVFGWHRRPWQLPLHARLRYHPNYNRIFRN